MPNLALSKKFLIAIVITLMLTAPVLALAQNQQSPQTPPAETGSCGWNVFCHIVRFFRWVSLQIGYLISYIAAALVSFAASLIQTIITMSGTLTASAIVREGFKITLNLANLGFVLVIIWIAFATILRVFDYEIKRVIPSLIVAALLVNFSFAIAGIFIDFSNITGFFFLKASAPENISAFADNLAYALNVQTLLDFQFGDTTELAGLLEVGTGFASSLASVIMAAIFNVTLVITFFAVAFMLLVRYIVLTFLLILMPLAWVAWVIPELAGHWKEWWNTFFRWVFFLPAMMIFLYLSIFTSQTLGDLIKTSSQNQLARQAVEKITNTPSETIVAFLQIIVQIGLLIGGLIAANKFGISVASASIALAGKARGWISGAAGKVGKGAAAPWLNRLIAKGGLMDKASSGLAKLSTTPLRFIPGARAALTAASSGLSSVVSSRQDAVANYQKNNLAKLNDDALQAIASRPMLNPVANAAIAVELAKRNMTDKIPGKRLDVMLSHAKSMGVTKQILENRADLAPKLIDRKPGQTDEEILRTVIAKLSPADILKQSAEALKNTKMVASLKTNQLSQLIKNGSGKQIETLLDSVDKLREEQPDHPIVQFMINNPAARRVIFESTKQYKILGAAAAIREAEIKIEEEEARRKAAAEMAKEVAKEVAAAIKEAKK